LPAGEVQLAVGAGYRGNTLNTNIRSTRGAITTTPTSYVSQQDVVFGYGELSLPLVGENNQLPLIRLLKLTAALRYEDYAHVGGTATPKIGLRYSPVRDLDISATWGRSFKAPTLAQASRTPTGDLLPADFFVPEAPGGVPVLFLGGAIPGLAPERATSWNTTITYKPSFIEGLRIEASYFETHYRDRGRRTAGRWRWRVWKPNLQCSDPLFAGGDAGKPGNSKSAAWSDEPNRPTLQSGRGRCDR
jgi:outer membrane receptor protein involved in Fe transport